MFWWTLAGNVVSWSSYLLQHRADFEPIFRQVGGVADFAQAVVANPDGAVRRVGNTLIFGKPDGGQQVMAFIEQTSPQIESIQHAVSGLQASQAALSSSLTTLQNLSMVTLGLTALTPVVLSVQFVALTKRLGALQKQIADLHKKFDASVVADLETGLDLLRQGQDFLMREDRHNAHSRLEDALPFCHRTMKFYATLLGNSLQQAKASREEIRLLARHLAVAIAGVASCQIGLEQDQHAFSQSGQALGLLQQASGRIFHELVSRDPAPFLLPGMRPYGVTIDFMVQLFQQARDAGALAGKEFASISAWFEEHRPALVCASQRMPLLSSRKKWYDALHAQLREAASALEETNRVLGLSHLVEHVRGSGQTTLCVMEEYRQQVAGRSAEECPYMAWGLS